MGPRHAPLAVTLLYCCPSCCPAWSVNWSALLSIVRLTLCVTNFVPGPVRTDADLRQIDPPISRANAAAIPRVVVAVHLLPRRGDANRAQHRGTLSKDLVGDENRLVLLALDFLLLRLESDRGIRDDEIAA